VTVATAEVLEVGEARPTNQLRMSQTRNELDYLAVGTHRYRAVTIPQNCAYPGRQIA